MGPNCGFVRNVKIEFAKILCVYGGRDKTGKHI